MKPSRGLNRRIGPQSLQGQMLLAVALALLLAQGFSALLIYRAQAERREAVLIGTAAFRLLAATGARPFSGHHMSENGHGMGGDFRRFMVERTSATPLRQGETRMERAEEALRDVLAEQDRAPADLIVLRRPIREDRAAMQHARLRDRMWFARSRPGVRDVMVAAVQPVKGGEWFIARVLIPPGERTVILSLIGQTLLIYGLLVGAIALILRRISQPLAALTRRVERFAETRDPADPLEPDGPDDVRRLIQAHNAMEARVAAMLDEKDVMLGAIGHDLKTPLAALRVRIESVEDERERQRMAQTIEDIAVSLDDILSLARVGRPTDPLEPTELTALIASVVDEHEDMGEPVSFAEAPRTVLSIRATWLRRAVRNLVSNALRYGKTARVSLDRDSRQVTIRIDDDGPGIAETEIDRMMEPFARGEGSRNRNTGGAGLGLALARAIAEQHGGTLTLSNRPGASGAPEGLTATLSLPLT